MLLFLHATIVCAFSQWNLYCLLFALPRPKQKQEKREMLPCRCGATPARFVICHVVEVRLSLAFVICHVAVWALLLVLRFAMPLRLRILFVLWFAMSLQCGSCLSCDLICRCGNALVFFVISFACGEPLIW